MAVIDRYLDTGLATGSHTGVDWDNAYASLSAWQTGEVTDLVTDTDSHILHWRTTGEVAEIAFILSGWTTSATYDLTIQVDVADRHLGVWDATKPRIVSTSTPFTISSVDNVNIIGFQLDCSYTGASIRYGITTVGNANINISHTIVKFSGTATGTARGYNISTAVAASPVILWNCIAYDCPERAFTFSGENNSIFVYNCSSIDSGVGFLTGSSDSNIYNCVSFGCTTPYSGTFGTASYCAYDSGTDPGSNGIDISSEVGTDLFNDYNNDDFMLKSGSALIGVGTDNPEGGSLYSDDIKSDTRTSTWDIGAAEYVVAGGINIPVVMHHRRMII